MTTLIEYARLYGQPLKGVLLEADDTIKQLTEENARLREALELVPKCSHRIVAITNEHVKSGFMCVKCGKLFAE